jgi:hypothetical protein
MGQFFLDANVSSQLYSLSQPVELCDPTGRVIGKYVPLVDLTEWEPISPDISEEELDRRVKSDEPSYTTAEVLAHLRSL